MSTKASILYQKDKYHLYAECFEGKNVYLSLDMVNFEASPRGIMVEIPREIWNQLIKSGEIPIESDADIDADFDNILAERKTKPRNEIRYGSKMPTKKHPTKAQPTLELAMKLDAERKEKKK